MEREKERNKELTAALIPVYLCVKRTRASSGARNNALSNDVKSGKNFQTMERRATRPFWMKPAWFSLSKELIHSHLSKWDLQRQCNTASSNMQHEWWRGNLSWKNKKKADENCRKAFFIGFRKFSLHFHHSLASTFGRCFFFSRFTFSNYNLIYRWRPTISSHRASDCGK